MHQKQPPAKVALAVLAAAGLASVFGDGLCAATRVATAQATIASAIDRIVRDRRVGMTGVSTAGTRTGTSER
jgi:hypothetical protein